MYNHSHRIVDDDGNESSDLDHEDTKAKTPKSRAPSTIKRRKFTDEEDRRILEGHQRYNTNWEEVIKSYGLDRTPSQVSTRFKRISKKSQSTALISTPTPAPIPSAILSATPTAAPSFTPSRADDTQIINPSSNSNPPLSSSTPLSLTPTLLLTPNTVSPGMSPSLTIASNPTSAGGGRKDITTYLINRANSDEPAMKQRKLSVSTEASSSPLSSSSSSLSSPLPPIGPASNSILPSITSSNVTISPNASTVPIQTYVQMQAQLQQIIQQREAELKACHTDRERLERGLERAMKERDDAIEEARRESERHQHYRSRGCGMIQNLAVRLATAERRLTRHDLLNASQRLGVVVVERRMMDLQEVWHDGDEFKELAQREASINKEKEALEATRKVVQNRRRVLNKAVDNATGEPSAATQDALSGSPGSSVSSSLSSSSSSSGSVSLLSADELWEQNETIKLRLSMLKRDEAELVVQREKLLSQKLMHIRDLKRHADEEQSSYSSFPVLINRYLLLSLLGKGGFSEVFRALDLVELREVACKIHCVNPAWPAAKKANYSKHAMREYMIHKELNHPRVVRLFDVFEIDYNSFCTVLEFCEGGDLDTYLKQYKQLPESEARSIAVQMFAGLKHLSEQKRPIIHYDLKPGNILFHKGEIKITDFGLSKIMEENSDQLELTSQGAGTYWYLPPECFETGAPKISSKVDVWSAGVILFQMLYGKKPFGHNLSQQRVLQDNLILQAKSVEFPAKPTASKEAKDFITRCLTYTQEARPDVFECVEDPFIQPKQTTRKSDSSKMPPPARKPVTLKTKSGSGSIAPFGTTPYGLGGTDENSDHMSD
eukprot:TRINITY_DN2580_c0_g1_i2.p1 TRINITY_DN2580_c0_g1~~TRINITY_DN2580_c0_g1_i2.p1  ORF type:complete len:947 (-),score=194.37 TRINITY_DN2580_c0_g1_i2:105-2603(-)